MNHGYSLEKFCNLFSLNYSKNDRIIDERYCKHIKDISKKRKSFENKLYVGNDMY